jgi:hypothetical protein
VSSGTPELQVPLAEQLTLDDMLERFVLNTSGPQVIDLLAPQRRMRPHEFRQHYASSIAVVGKRVVPVTSQWFQHCARLTVDAATFDPAQQRFYSDCGRTFFNTWTPPQWPQTDLDLAAPFVDHMHYLVPSEGERNDLLDTIAHAAQQPGVRPHCHPLLIAQKQGTGRSWMNELLRELWAPSAVEVDLHRLLDDQFNSTIAGKIITCVNEVKAPPSERYSHRDRLKSLLTDTVLTVNEKHVPRWTEKFVARFIMATNAEDSLPLSETDRRIQAIRCADEPRSSDYYTSLYAALKDKTFLASCWHYFASRDIAAFNPGRRAPLTDTKLQLIHASRTEEQAGAVELVITSPHDVIASIDLMRLCCPPTDRERDHERRTRTSAAVAAIRELGVSTHPKKVKLSGTSTRMYVVRNFGAWREATPARLAAAATAARADFERAGWIADAVLDLWRLPPVAAVPGHPLSQPQNTPDSKPRQPWQPVATL